MKKFDIEDIIWKSLVFGFRFLSLNKEDSEIKTITTSELNSKINIRNKNSIKLFNSNISLSYNGYKKLKSSYWLGIEKSLDLHGYDPKKFDYIKVNNRNFIIDGYIRSHFLLTKKGNKHKIDVMVIKNKPRNTIKKIYWVLLTSMILIFSLFIYFITN